MILGVAVLAALFSFVAILGTFTAGLLSAILFPGLAQSILARDTE